MQCPSVTDRAKMFISDYYLFKRPGFPNLMFSTYREYKSQNSFAVTGNDNSYISGKYLVEQV